MAQECSIRRSLLKSQSKEMQLDLCVGQHYAYVQILQAHASTSKNRVRQIMMMKMCVLLVISVVTFVALAAGKIML